MHSGEGSIYAIAWRGSLIAWANDIGVKGIVFLLKTIYLKIICFFLHIIVYDTEASQRITYIARERPAPVSYSILFKITVPVNDILKNKKFEY